MSRHGISSMALIAAAGVLLAAGQGRAQFYSGRVSTTFYTTGTSSSQPQYEYYPSVSGFAPSYVYPLGPSTFRMRPTYLTSINYPWQYGAYNTFLSGEAPTFGREEEYLRTVRSFESAPNVSAPAPLGTAYLRAQGARPVGAVAWLDVRVPAEADLWVQGQRMTVTGAERRFTSPSLTPGRDYTYDVRATWSEEGRSVTQERRVTVRAGDRIGLDLRSTPITTEEPTLRTAPALRAVPPR